MQIISQGENKMKNSKDDLIFEGINLFFVTIFFIITLYPMLFVITASISDPNLVSMGKVIFLPRGINFIGYKKVFNYNEIWTGYMNTIFYTIGGVLFGLFIIMTAAYPLSRKEFEGKKLILIMYTIPMYFSGGLIPTYLLVRNLKMVDTVWTQIILGAAGFWNIVVVRTFYQKSIPFEIQEAAVVDGCSHFRLLLYIILPLSKPVIAVMSLFLAVAKWNSWFPAMIYLSKRKMYPLQLILREILILETVDPSMLDEMDMINIQEQVKTQQLLKYCLIIVSTLPVIAAYPFLQKYFVKGMMVGSIKG
jgi:putative aldouronate transport system permease protein